MAFTTARPLKAIFQTDGDVILGEFLDTDVLEIINGGTGTTNLDEFRQNLKTAKFESFSTFDDFDLEPEDNRFAKDLETGKLYYSHNLEWIKIGNSQVVSGKTLDGFAHDDVEVEKMVFDGDLIFNYDQETKIGTLTVSTALTAMDLQIGTPTDGTYSDGAISIVDTKKTADVIDELNEALDNVRNDTFVKSVSFVSDKTTGGEGITIQLAITFDGNPNRFDIDWGDGTQSTDVRTTYPTHIYSSNEDSPYTIQVRGYHSNGVGSGSESFSIRENYIIIYTADPNVKYEFYRYAQGGTKLSGNSLYVIAGQQLFLENKTSQTLMADVTYDIDWGDGTNSHITSDAEFGGALGGRLEHTWDTTQASGTGKTPVEITLSSHTTADPQVIPRSFVDHIKIYDPNIIPPEGLNTKTIQPFPSQGISPKIAYNFSDNTTNSPLSAGQSVTRTTKTSGNLSTTEISSFAYNANSGNLSALVNRSANGTANLSTDDNSGKYGSLVITQEKDYHLLNSSGVSTSFSNSIYHPLLFTGFKCKVETPAADIPNGVNSLSLSHSETGDTNSVYFLKDDLTDVPVTIEGTIEEKTKNYRYISGIPYYKKNSSLLLKNFKLTKFIGQTYRSSSSVVNVVPAVNEESTSGNVISNQGYSYSQIEGDIPFLENNIPIANTGKDDNYTLGDLQVNITSGNVRSVQKIKINAENVNGSGNYIIPDKKIVAHTSSQSDISEISIPVESTLGSGFNDNGIRIFDFAQNSISNPIIDSNINYFDNNTYSEDYDLGLEGTQEATIRFGELEHNTQDYSQDYFPIGPDRSSDTGIQYFTFAFRRKVVANFKIRLVANGISGIWIAAPGSDIDSTSTIHGWLDCSLQYAGAGIPGENTSGGGNGSNGCAVTGSDIIGKNIPLNNMYEMTLGSENLTNSTGNVALVRIALNSNQKITTLEIKK